MEDNDLDKLSEIKFPHHAVNSDDRNKLIMFCDASKQAYDFAAYLVSSKFINSKK